LVVRDATGGSTISGSLLWDVTTDYWKAGKVGSEAKVLVAVGDNVFTSSIQTSISGTFGYSDFSSSLATTNSASVASVTSLSASNASTNNTQTTNITEASASAWGAFTSASSYSASIYTRDANQDTNITANSASAWGAFQSASSYSASIYTRDANQDTNITTNSASAAGAFASASSYSGSAATALNTLSSSVATSFSASVASQTIYSSSVATSISASVAAGTPTFANITGKPAGLVSGSSQIVLNDADFTGFNTTDVAEGTNLYYTDARVKTKLNAETVVSGSIQTAISGTFGYATFSGSIVTSVSESNHRITQLETTIDGGSF
jgi:hypothetical protein